MMNEQEIRHRDGVLHDYFYGRNWDKNGEYALKRKLVINRGRLLPNYPYVIEEEWEVTDNRTDLGRGDLVFTDGDGSFAVVEVKWIDLDGHLKNGKNRRENNRQKRRKVEEQSIEYALAYYNKLVKNNSSILKAIEAFYFTNESNKPTLIRKITDPQLSV
jgi:hypothetical protein